MLLTRLHNLRVCQNGFNSSKKPGELWKTKVLYHWVEPLLYLQGPHNHFSRYDIQCDVGERCSQAKPMDYREIRLVSRGALISINYKVQADCSCSD